MIARRPLAALVAAALAGACAQQPSVPDGPESPPPAPTTIFVKPSGGPRVEAARRHRELARTARASGDLATARDHLAVVVLVEPDDAAARQELDALGAEIRKRVNGHLEEAREAQRGGDSGRASSEYLRVLALDPRNAEATRALREIDRQNMARAQASRASRVRVEDLFADARAQRPAAAGKAAPAGAPSEARDASYDLEAKIELLRAADPTVALRELKIWVDANPRDRAARQKIGAAVADRAKEAEGKQQKALAYALYEQAVALRGEPQKDWTASAAALRKQVGDERYAEGVRLMRTDLDAAVRSLEAATQADPKNALAAAKLREAQAAQQKLKRLPAR